MQQTTQQTDEFQNGSSERLVFGDYVVVAKLGSGGMGCVYQARHRASGKVVALKVLNPAVVDSKVSVDRFKREIKATQRLAHPSIVKVIDSGEADGTHYLVMPYVAGRNLQLLVDSDGPLSVDLARHCLLQAAQGLRHAHSQGIIHRDIKPSNLVLDEQHRLTILDMGLARIDPRSDVFDPDTETRLELTRAGVVIGTLDYVAPEQAQDGRQADARSDIYSLGCTLHFLLTGQPVFGGRTAVDKLVSHRTAPIPILSEIRSDVPKVMDRIFQRMLAKSPDDRMQSMARLIAELQPRFGIVKHLAIAAAFITTVTVAGTTLWSRPQSSTTDMKGPAADQTRADDVAAPQNQITETPATAFRKSHSVSLSTDREFAAWVLEIGGSLEMTGAGGVTVTIDPATGLPAGELRIRGLNLTNRSISNNDNFNHLSHLTGLQHLFLNGSDVEDKQLIELSHLVNLRLLFLNNTRVSDSGLQHVSRLSELRYLDLIGTRITDAGLAQLKSLKHLESLRVQQTAVTAAGVESLKQSLPNCRVAH